jgi:hypothetical protein
MLIMLKALGSIPKHQNAKGMAVLTGKLFENSKLVNSGKLFETVILATQEAENRRIMVQSHPGEIVLKTLSQKHSTQKRAGGVVQGVDSESKPQYHKKNSLLEHKWIQPIAQGRCWTLRAQPNTSCFWIQSHFLTNPSALTWFHLLLRPLPSYQPNCSHSTEKYYFPHILLPPSLALLFQNKTLVAQL